MRALLFALLLSPCALALAQAPANAFLQPDMRRAIEDFLRAQTANLPGEVSFETGKLPDTARYSACQGWQAFLPAGARAWGRISVGVRCVAGGNFSFYAGAKVKVMGDYLVAARAITNGQRIEAGDIKRVQGELTAQAPDILLKETDAIGQSTRSAIAIDKPLQAALLRADSVVEAGQTVKVISSGSGFAVSNEGQALSSASVGQLVRVRLANGSVVSGIAKDKGLIELRN